jgi:c(7)-type cytochrome triheme protein
LVVLLAGSASAAEPGSGKKRRPPPGEYGRVVLANHSPAARLAPVVFDHWVHRARYTCRLCHIDLGFSMKAGETDVKAADNIAGQYCGACHNGRTVSSDGHRVFEACARVIPADTRSCDRCHSQGKELRPENDFATLARKLPHERFGNGIDWERAELQKLIRPIDFLEGVSIKRQQIQGQKDFALTAKLEGMPNIIFSHAKHTTWNGCELCHPEIFKVRRGATRNSMVQIFDGQSCGTCHTTVAFPLVDCQRCHTAPVQAPVQ